MAVCILMMYCRELYALPQFSLLTGNRCINCHVTTQGSGLRNELGWYSMSDVGLIDTTFPGLAGVETNTFFDGMLLAGLDFRLQRIRSHKSADAESKIFPMQAAVHLAVLPTTWLTVEGSYNVGDRKRYNGQQSWSGSAIVQPGFSWPELRAGFFQPSIGMRYDDHTMLVRQVAGADGVPLIAPNFAEWGAEISYNSLKWLTVTAGAFDAGSLAENQVTGKDSLQHSLVTDRNTPSVLGRVVFWPRLFENRVPMYAGASLLANGDFSLANVFAGVGLLDNVSLMAEYAHSSKKELRATNNFSVDVNWQALDALMVYVRGERGVTTLTALPQETEVYTNQIVIGTQIFVLPFVELRPEYRWVDTEAFTSTRYAVQLHLFY
jgi:hypothetical protein